MQDPDTGCDADRDTYGNALGTINLATLPAPFSPAATFEDCCLETCARLRQTDPEACSDPGFGFEAASLGLAHGGNNDVCCAPGPERKTSLISYGSPPPGCDVVTSSLAAFEINIPALLCSGLRISLSPPIVVKPRQLSNCNEIDGRQRLPVQYACGVASLVDAVPWHLPLASMHATYLSLVGIIYNTYCLTVGKTCEEWNATEECPTGQALSTASLATYSTTAAFVGTCCADTCATWGSDNNECPPGSEANDANLPLAPGSRELCCIEGTGCRRAQAQLGHCTV